MLRDTLKLEIDRLSEEQLRKLAQLIEEMKAQPELKSEFSLQDSKVEAAERLQRFREWADSRPHTGINLSDDAFNCTNIYD